MPLFPELTVILSVIALLLLYIILRLVNNSKAYLKKKNELIDKFVAQRNKSLKLQETLSQYVLSKNANKDILYDDITYGDYLRLLQKNHIQHLSEKKYNELKKSDNRIMHKKIETMLEEQANRFKEAEKILNPVFSA